MERPRPKIETKALFIKTDSTKSIAMNKREDRKSNCLFSVGKLSLAKHGTQPQLSVA